MNEPKEWLCQNCGQKFATFIDESVLSIPENNGQDYKVNFNYIEVVCKKCGERNSLMSRIHTNQILLKSFPGLFIEENNTGGIFSKKEVLSEIEKDFFSPKLENFFDLTPYYKNKFIKTLSATQKDIYRILFDNRKKYEILAYQNSNVDKFLSDISQQLNLNIRKVTEDVGKIIEGIKLVRLEEIEKRVGRRQARIKARKGSGKK